MKKCLVCLAIFLSVWSFAAATLHADVDLRLNSVDVRNTRVYVGEEIHVTYSVTNVAGDGAELGYWLDVDILSDPGDLGSSVYSFGYSSGGCIVPNLGETRDSRYFEFELNKVLDPGHYYVHVKIIPPGYTDLNPGDNSMSASAPFTVPPRSGPADVLATDCRINNHYLKDRSQSISGITAYLNNSTTTATNVTVGIYLSLDPVITADDILIAQENIGTLPDPFYRTMYFSVPIDPDLPDGNYYAGALASASNDSNSSNNVSLDGYPVLIGGPAKPKPGTLTVYISPAEVQDKAGWRLVGDDSWLKHGQSLENLSPDPYKIEFRPVSGYTTPAKRTVTIKSNEPAVVAVTYENTPVTPIVDVFEALPSSVYPGESARIIWKVLNVESVNILPIVGLRTNAGSYPIQDPESTTYKLSAKNSDGSVNASAKFRVIASRKIDLFTSNTTEDNPLHTSEPVKLYWSTRGISDISIDTDEDGIANVSTHDPSGTREISLTKSGYARLFGMSDHGNTSAETYIHITNLPVIRTFELPKNRVLVGERVAFRWKIPGMKTATIEPFGITTDQEEGIHSFVALKSMKVSIVASNEFGTVSKSQKFRIAKKGADLVLQLNNELNQRKDGTMSTFMEDESEFTADVTISNIGRKPAKNFFVSMYADGVLVNRKLVKTALRPGQSIDVQLSHMPSYSNGIPIRLVVDEEGIIPDENRRNNDSSFKLVVYFPHQVHVWIREVELTRLGKMEDDEALRLRFFISEFIGKGKSLYFYRVKFFKPNNKGGEDEVACLEGYPQERRGRSGFPVTRFLRLDGEALKGRMEIMVMNVSERNGFIDLNRTRSFFIPAIVNED